MTIHPAETRKIDPIHGPGPDRVEIGPTDLALAEWAQAGLVLPDLPAMRRYRLGRLVAQIAKRELGGLLLTDPLNIRYATDTTNMQVWNMHNPFRACLVTADGYMVLWDYKNAPFLAEFNPLVREVRSGASMFYFVNGDAGDAAAAAFAGDVADILRARVGRNPRLAVDKVMVRGLRALEAVGLEICDGEEVAEKARAIKGAEEIRAMRCAMHACETSVAAMERGAIPGLSEDEIWSCERAAPPPPHPHAAGRVD